MFRQNQRHRQMTMFVTVHQLPLGVKKADKSWAPAFRRLIFEKINERRYIEAMYNAGKTYGIYKENQV